MMCPFGEQNRRSTPPKGHIIGERGLEDLVEGGDDGVA
jgi:hypothetical protein